MKKIVLLVLLLGTFRIFCEVSNDLDSSQNEVLKSFVEYRDSKMKENSAYMRSNRPEYIGEVLSVKKDLKVNGEELEKLISEFLGIEIDGTLKDGKYLLGNYNEKVTAGRIFIPGKTYLDYLFKNKYEIIVDIYYKSSLGKKPEMRISVNNLSDVNYKVLGAMKEENSFKCKIKFEDIIPRSLYMVFSLPSENAIQYSEEERNFATIDEFSFKKEYGAWEYEKSSDDHIRSRGYISDKYLVENKNTHENFVNTVKKNYEIYLNQLLEGKNKERIQKFADTFNKGKEEIQLLIEEGKKNRKISEEARLKLKTFDQSALDKKLLKACRDENYGLMEELLKKGANVDYFYDKNETSLLIEAITYLVSFDMVKFLIKYGAVVDLTNKYGATALHYASVRTETKIIDIIDILLKAGADPFKKSDEGKTAFDYSTGAKFPESIEYLTNIDKIFMMNLVKF